MTPQRLANRLYLDDAKRERFDAVVTAHGEVDGQPSIALDVSAFYPEAGGQMADHGELGGARVTNVQLDALGVVQHVVEGALPAIGTRLHGMIDMPRRREHMALHTGQHILSRALHRELQADTISARLGETACTIDVNRTSLSDAELGRVIDLASSVVDDNLPVRAFFPREDELADLSLRKPSKVQTDIRIVTVGDFDATPCGGTHCASSAEVGLLHVSHLERHRGAMRIHFTAGARSRKSLGRAYDTVKGLSQQLSCGVDHVDQNVRAALDKVRNELKDSQQLLGSTRQQLATYMAKALQPWPTPKAAPSEEIWFVAAFADVSVDMVRAMAKALCREGNRVVALAVATAEGMHVVCSRSEGSQTDCGALVRSITSDGRGGGGGRPHHAEGRLKQQHDWPSLVQAATQP